MKQRFTRLISTILALAMLAELLPANFLGTLIPQASAAEVPSVTGFAGIPQPEELPTTVDAEIPPTIIIGEDLPAVNEAAEEASSAAVYASSEEEETEEDEEGATSGTPGIDAPYTFDVSGSENINLNTGDLIYSCTDFVIPGVNGLDLVIGRNYNSRCARQHVDAADAAASSSHSVLGQGWTWSFSTIQNFPSSWSPDISESLLRLPDGTTLEIKYILSEVYLSGYSADIKQFKYVGGNRSNKSDIFYVLDYLDGRQEHFDGYGRLKKITDGYNSNNCIQFSYDTANGFERITITDTHGNQIVISSEEKQSGSIATTVKLPNNISLRYQSVKETTPYSYTALKSYTNANGQTEQYSYTQQTGNQNTTRDTIDYYLNLTTVTHPTGAQTMYSYEKYNAYISLLSTYQRYRVTERRDRNGSLGPILNQKTFSYSDPDSSYSLYHRLVYDYSITVTEGSYQTVYNYKKELGEKSRHTETVSYQGTALYENTAVDFSARAETTKYFNHQTGAKDFSAASTTSRDKNGRILTSEKAQKPYAYYTYVDDQISESKLYLDSSTYIKTQNQISKNKIIESTISINGTYIPSTVYRRTKYEYDANGNLLKELRCTNPGESSADKRVFVPVVEYTYQDGAYLSQVIYRDVQTADGVAASTPNQPAGTIVTSYSYDNLGRMTAMVDTRGYTTSYAYDVLGNLTNVYNPDGTGTYYFRDYVSNYLVFADENNNQTRYTYTPLGLPQDVIDVLTGNVLSRREYDSMSRLIRLTDYVYGSVTEYTYDGYGNVNSETVLQGNTVLSRTTWVYNEPTADGQYLRNTKTVHGDSSTPDIVTTEYLDTYGNVAKTGRIIDGTEYFDTYTYDFQGAVLSVLRAADAAKNLPFTEKYEYNYNNQVTKHTNADGQVITNTYDAFDRLVQTTDYAGTPTTYTYDSLGRLLTKSVEVNPGDLVITKYEYDPAGNLTRERWPVIGYGESTPYWSERRYVYGSRNQRLETVELYDWDALAATTTYTYDPTGKLASVTSHNKTTSYTYDRYGNVLTMTDGLGQTESYEYNALGKVTTKTDRNGQTFHYGYDAMGRMVVELMGPEFHEYIYGPTGKLASVGNVWYRTNYSYDSAGRLTSVHEAEEDSGNAVPQQYDKTYTYDLSDNRIGFTLTRNGITVQSASYTYDNLNRLSTVSEYGIQQAAYTYDVNGNRATLTYANGVEESYTYNKANWVTSITNRLGDTVLSSYAYTYYPTGNQQTKTDHTGKTTNYVYDGLGRLEQEYDNAGLNICYFYDASHNRHFITYRNGSENYELYYYYDANNQLTEERKRQDGKYTTVASYTYDGNGNQLTKISADGIASYTYGAFGQQIGYTMNGITASYAYNVDGIRTSKTVNGERTSFLLDGGNVVGEVRDNQVFTTYLRGINLISQNGLYYYLYNAHGDVVGLTSWNGTVDRSYEYSAFGIEENPDAEDLNPFRYCGEYFDNETGTYYLRARYYAPSLGRFTQSDSIRYAKQELPTGLSIINPFSLNLYSYCYNNPIRFTDPSGHITKDEMQMYEEGKMAPGAYSYLMECTYNYYLAKTKTGKDYWHKKAEKFRKSGYTDTGDKNWNTIIKKMPSRPTKITTKESHYFRNELNIQYDWEKFQRLNERLPDHLKWHELSFMNSLFHKFGAWSNRKYVSACGHFEAVYTKDNKLVDETYSSTNMGTYNYYSPTQKTNHYNVDVEPWLKWGNVEGGGLFS